MHVTRSKPRITPQMAVFNHNLGGVRLRQELLDPRSRAEVPITSLINWGVK